MAEKILISTAYLPPVAYFSLISQAEMILIEKEENYIKQTYRNRCYILSSDGSMPLSVPVYLGSFHKTPVKDIRIDYSKRWQQIHLRAMKTAYSSSPYFEFYFEEIERIIAENHTHLIDLNMELMVAILKMLGIKTPVSYTSYFEPAGTASYDYRYKITPKKNIQNKGKEYIQVFQNERGFTQGLSIIDLIFNIGPDSAGYM